MFFLLLKIQNVDSNFCNVCVVSGVSHVRKKRKKFLLGAQTSSNFQNISNAKLGLPDLMDEYNK